MPRFIPPMLATLVAAPFDNPDWQFEVKWDGFRVEAIVEGDEVRIWTRGEQDAGRYFGSFLAPPSWIAAREAIVDGEVIALDDHGEPDFALLQARIKGQGQIGTPTPFVYEVFDLLWLDGRSLLDEPLETRRRLLAEALRPDPRVRLSEHITGDGIAFFEAARVRGLEGIMAKDRRSPYVPGARSMAWQKVKIRPEQELVVGGMTRGTGKAVELGALLVGVYEDGALRYAGKIGAGFNDRIRAELLAALEPLVVDASAFAEPPPRAVSRERDLGAAGSGDPRRVRGLDRRRARAAGGLQGLRPRQGSSRGPARAPTVSPAGSGDTANAANPTRPIRDVVAIPLGRVFAHLVLEPELSLDRLRLRTIPRPDREGHERARPLPRASWHGWSARTVTPTMPEAPASWRWPASRCSSTRPTVSGWRSRGGRCSGGRRAGSSSPP